MLRRAILIACGVAALASAAAVTVVALGFALYAALMPVWGPALAAAGVAGACVLLIFVGGVLALMLALPKSGRAEPVQENLTARVFGLAREKPVIAAVALVLAGLVAIRNPKITATLVGAFMATKSPKKD